MPSKTLSLKRAYFSEGFNGTLEDILRYSFKSLGNARDRTVPHDLVKSILFADIEEASKGVFVRVFEFENGAIGVINLDQTDKKGVVEEFFHPDQRHFLKEEALILVVGNHLVACNMKNKARTYSLAVLQLATNAQVLSEDVGMTISEVPDQTTLERVAAIGVKSIDFSITSYLASMPMTKAERGWNPLLGLILGQVDPAEDVKKRSGSVGRMKLSRGRYEKDEVEKDVWLTRIGQEILQDDLTNDFTIVLEDNSRIKNDTLRQSKSVDLPRYANSFSVDHAKLALIDYFNRLVASGALDA